MEFKKSILSLVFLMLIFTSLVSHVYSFEGFKEEDSIENNSFFTNPEGIVIFLSSILALILFLLTLKTYLVDKRKKFLFITIAFGLFALKGFILSSELFFSEISSWVEVAAEFLDFGILISFFVGLLKK